MNAKTYKFCQSCGMPLKKDENGGGTEKDGSKSTMYCSRCYSKGEFTSPKMSFDMMKALVKRKLASMGHGKFMQWFFTSNMHKLERWKTK